MSDAPIIPNWFREISSFSGIISTFILEGNIYDIYPCYNSERGRYDFKSINDAVMDIFKDSGDENGYDFLFYNLATGFFDPEKSDEENKKTSLKLSTKRSWLNRFNQVLLTLNEKRSESTNQLVRDSEVIKATLTTSGDDAPDDGSDKPVSIVLDFASRFLSSPDNLTEDEIAFFLNLQYASNNAKTSDSGYKNTLILIVDKFSDIPSWFTCNNPNIRRVTVPNPDRSIREIAVEFYYGSLWKDDAKKLQQYVDLTDGMKLAEIRSLRIMLGRNRETITDVSDLISIYKYGYKENKWRQIREKLSLEKDIEGKIQERVKGQKRAVEKAVDIIKRAVTGVSGLQHSSATKPKGILFFAGTTGTGKTELVKAIAKLLFEDERAIVRFDMSEYHEENSDQKLFGAPPGYVGYSQGGQLTNAVRANPFSILLFDEIEKANPTIMDKFLQILEDGRMTDGQGNTVYFSETMIFFTSNEGTYKEVTDPDGNVRKESVIHVGDPYEKIETTIMSALKKFFKPEVFNRIGENNFVVFEMINAEVAEAIAEAMLTKINEQIEKEQEITLNLTQQAKERLKTLCKHEDYLKYGGRGVGNAIEEHYLNPLGKFLFDDNIGAGAEITVSVSDDDPKLVFTEN